MSDNTKCFNIPWYYNDSRFRPGTVADIGNSIRLTLRQKCVNGGSGARIPSNEYRLYFQMRTHKSNGVRDDLKYENCVAVFKKCFSLEEAQELAQEWLTSWIFSMLSNFGNFYDVFMNACDSFSHGWEEKE